MCEYSITNDTEIVKVIKYAVLEATAEAVYLSKTEVKPNYLMRIASPVETCHFTLPAYEWQQEKEYLFVIQLKAD